MHQVPTDDARYPLLGEIRPGALWAIQSRELRGILSAEGRPKPGQISQQSPCGQARGYGLGRIST